MTMGAFTSPLAHELVDREPRPSRGRRIQPADPRRQSLERDPLGASTSHRGRSLLGEGRAATASIVTAMSAGSPDSAAQRNGPSRDRRAAGYRPGRSPGMRTRPRTPPPGPHLAGCCHNRKHTRPPDVLEHRLDVAAHARVRARDVPVRVGRTELGRLLDRQAGGDVAVERVVRGGLLGDQSRARAPRSRARGRRRPRCREARSDGRFPARRGVEPRERVVEIGGALLEVAVSSRFSMRAGSTSTGGAHARHRRRERLRAAHAAEAGGQYRAAARPGAPECLLAAAANVWYVPCRIPCVPM